VLHEEPRSPRKLNNHIPRDLETICLKAMAKAPSRRYASARALADELRRWQNGEPIQARPVSSSERFGRWCRRNPVLATLSAALLLLLTGTAIGGVLMSLRLHDALGQAKDAERDGKHKLFASYASEVNANRFSRRPGQRFASLEAIRKAKALLPELGLSAEEEDQRRQQLRNLAIACLTLPDVRLVKEWEGWPQGSVWPPMPWMDKGWEGWPHDGGVSLWVDDRMERYARSDQQGSVSVRRVADDQEVYHLAGDGKPVGILLAESGLLVLARSDHRIEGWKLGADRPTCTIPGTGPLGNYRLTRDERMLAVARLDGSIRLYLLPEGHLLRDLRGPETGGDIPIEAQFSPDGNLLAVNAGKYGQSLRRIVLVYDVRTDRPPVELEHPDSVHGIAWYPDSRTIATGGCNNNEIYLWDVPTGQKLQVITSQKGGAPNLGINRRGDLFTSASDWWGGVKVWHAQTGTLLLTVPETWWGFQHTTPDGRLFYYASAGSKLRLVECVPGDAHRTLVRDLRAEKGKAYEFPSLHPDGRLLAVGMESGVGLWDLPSGREVAFLEIGETRTVAFEPSGNLLTFGQAGLLRWPARADSSESGRLRLGPPQRLLDVPSWDRRMALSRDGRVLAAATGNGAAVFHADRPHRAVRLGPHSDVRGIAISPDGRWVATQTHAGHGVKVWEASTGRHVKDLVPRSQVQAIGITPDGKWSITNSRGFEVGSWREGVGVKDWNFGWGCVSADGSLHAQYAGEVVRLSDRATGRQLAELSTADQGRLPFLTFNADAAQLIGTDHDNLTIHVWDLRRLRRELGELGLDWEAEPYPPAKSQDVASTAPLVVDVVGVELAADRKAMAEYQRSQAAVDLYVNPFNPDAHYRLGRELLREGNSELAHAHLTAAVAFRPDFEAALLERCQAALRLRRWDEAVADASRCLEKTPHDGAARSLRAEAHRMLARYEEAAADYTAAIEREPRDPKLYEGRAVCYAALGKQDLAQADREQALKIQASSPRP
jgi:WD40 repeat protein/Flp pilus assembly protein TadD